MSLLASCFLLSPEKERRPLKGWCQLETRKTNRTASAILVDAKYVDLRRRTHLDSHNSSLQKQGSDSSYR
ncbi:hypothetical protein MRB53_009673 [Persea americana]|uniref:Uncharacterized protein n=1 Tax=Persea americana TaxID=3435 RepID=A0ACC2LQU4_PERAE|nr:hypothetical protein MRB53_009673 [Persea americana]